MLICTFVMMFLEDGTLVSKHVGVDIYHKW